MRKKASGAVGYGAPTGMERADGFPEKYVERRGDTGIALCDYEATELSVSVGEELRMGKEESGWIWCTNQKGQSGWVPADHVERL
jgi:hypothetical protein